MAVSSYCCIKCMQPLELSENFYNCSNCGQRYQVFAGIPNFKPDEIYPGETAILEDLASKYDKLGFIELLEYADTKEEKNGLPWEFRRASRFTEKSPEERKKWLNNYSDEVIIKSGTAQMEVTKKALTDAAIKNSKEKTCLDIGCGRGPWAVIASNIYKHIFALDMDMASLIIAKKYCDIQGITNITFLSASSSALPFPDNSFDLINSQAVLEHVDIQLKTLQEINRILNKGGWFIGDSVNRYNLFTPEPHIDLRLIGFIPKPWAHKISLALKKFPYDDIKPLSYGELNNMLHHSFVSNYKIVPFIEQKQFTGITQSTMKHMPTSFLKHFTHTHYIVASK